jgi:hypothetical protein
MAHLRDCKTCKQRKRIPDDFPVAGITNTGRFKTYFSWECSTCTNEKNLKTTHDLRDAAIKALGSKCHDCGSVDARDIRKTNNSRRSKYMRNKFIVNNPHTKEYVLVCNNCAKQRTTGRPRKTPKPTSTPKIPTSFSRQGTHEAPEGSMIDQLRKKGYDI